jgi:membrane associated rhomboid family serine protease
MDLEHPFSFRNAPPVVRTFIAVHALFFVLQIIPSVHEFVVTQLAFHPAGVLGGLKLWQPLTFTWPCAAYPGEPLWYLINFVFDIYLLWSFGREMEMRWGSAVFLRFVLFTSACAAAPALVFSTRFPEPVLGPWSLNMALVTVVGMMFPGARISFFFFQMQALYMVIALAVLALMMAVFQGASSALAYLGGMAGGYAFLRVGVWRLRARGVPARVREWWSGRRRRREETRLYDLDQEVDRILEKVSRQGSASLTDDERELMRSYSRLKR